MFHEECIGDSRRVEDGRRFDTFENQVQSNGDVGRQLVVKMDVEGSEWESFLGASDELLQRIDQMAVEFHGVDEARFVLAMSRLKEHFYVANLHWNNFGCDAGNAPFRAWAYELLLVNKRIGVPDTSQAGDAQSAGPAEQPRVARLPGRRVELAPPPSTLPRHSLGEGGPS